MTVTLSPDSATSTSPSRSPHLGRRVRSRQTDHLQRAWFTPYAFLIPFMVLFLPFGLGSVLLGIGVSFVDWPVGGAPRFVGTANFESVVMDPTAAIALGNTVKMLIAFLAILIPVCLFVGLCLSTLRAGGRKAVMVLLYLPIALSLIAVAMTFDLLFDDQIGLIHGITQALGLPTIEFFRDPSIAPWAIVVLRLWRVIGYYAIIMFAGMQGIPRDVYEASALDGAGPFRTFWSITLPMLRPVTLFVLVASSIAAWEVFAEPNILTDGGPALSTYTAVMYVYHVTFESFSLGRGAAAGVLLALCIVITTLVANRVLRRRDV